MSRRWRINARNRAKRDGGYLDRWRAGDYGPGRLEDEPERANWFPEDDENGRYPIDEERVARILEHSFESQRFRAACLSIRVSRFDRPEGIRYAATFVHPETLERVHGSHGKERRIAIAGARRKIRRILDRLEKESPPARS